MLVVTKGEHGCSMMTPDEQVDVPAVPPTRIVDPTGVGDAFRGGFMKGLVAGADIQTCGRLGSVAATYALEHLGGSSHAYTSTSSPPVTRSTSARWTGGQRSRETAGGFERDRWHSSITETRRHRDARGRFSGTPIAALVRFGRFVSL